MTIAAGLLCHEGVVFGADTEESVGDMCRRVHKIPTNVGMPPAIITGACLNGHLMDTAVERIMDALKAENPPDIDGVGELLKRIMTSLYRGEFKTYPDDKKNKRLTLLVAVKPKKSERAEAWTIDSTSMHRFQRAYEILGTGELLDFVAARLFVPSMPVDLGRLAMVQLLAIAKKSVQFVGGESYVHVLRNDGGIEMTNFQFAPEEENLYEFFFETGRALMLSAGAGSVSNQDFDKILEQFIKQIKWKRNQIVSSGRR